jgi:hypothetical protein
MVLSEPPSFESDLPPIDERLVEPGTRYEMYDGELVHVPPADAPHATQHARTSTLVEGHVRAEFQVACDMLTRTSRTSDVAPDVSVFPRAPDPATGRRQLEQVAFEVVSTESLGHASRKAAMLAARGVRRVFAIDVRRGRVLEWSGAAGWRMLDMTGAIGDPVFAAPLPLPVLLAAGTADDAIARVLLVKENPVLMEMMDRRHREGLSDGLLTVLEARGVLLAAGDRARILEETDPQRLERWLVRAAHGE